MSLFYFIFFFQIYSLLVCTMESVAVPKQTLVYLEFLLDLVLRIKFVTGECLKGILTHLFGTIE